VIPATTRDEWLKALRADPDVTPPQMAVAGVFFSFAGRDEPGEVWAEIPAIHERTKLGETTVRFALDGRRATLGTPTRRPERRIRGLIERGWLVRVRRHRQHYAPRYILCIPDPELPVDVPEPPPAPPKPPAAVSGEPGANQAPSRTEPDAGPAPACRAIRDELPAAARPDLPVLAREVRPLLTRGWTPAQLADATRTRPGGWSSAGPGAVIAWLRGLVEPPAPPAARPLWCGECAEVTRQRHDAEDRPFPCPVCHPSRVPAFSGG
jgi:hypothetical protein